MFNCISVVLKLLALYSVCNVYTVQWMQWKNKYIFTHIVYSTMSVTVCAMYTLWGDWDMCARCAAPAAKWLRQPIVTSINGRWVGGWSPQDYKPDHGNIVGHFTRNDKKVQNIVKMVPILLTTAISLLLGKPSWEKKCFLSGIARKGGGVGRTLPKFVDPFFHHVVPYILTSISCYVILFGHF